MFTILKFSQYLHNFYSQCDPGTHCTLYAFLMDYIKDVFLGQIHADNGDALNSASLSLGKNNCINCKICINFAIPIFYFLILDSWKAISDSDLLRELGVQRPLLQSTVDIKKSIDDLNNYMKTLPLYSEHFLTMICSMVMQYKVSAYVKSYTLYTQYGL